MLSLARMHMRFVEAFLLSLLLALFSPPQTAASPEEGRVALGNVALGNLSFGNVSFGNVSFGNDVMAVLSRGGCNQGICHGNKNGKGGFKLSLRGQDPGADFDTLTSRVFARRLNRMDPGRSLVLLKATGQVSHEGGLCFPRDSREYRILNEWIASGARRDPDGVPTLSDLEVQPGETVLVAPKDRVQIRAEAVFSDGSRRDVTTLAVYETSNENVGVDGTGLAQREGFGEVTVLVRYLQLQVPVRLTFVPAREDFVWKELPSANYIDDHVLAKLRKLRLEISPPCRDATFLRRSYLDLLGTPPRAAEARAFLADSRPDRRARLVDALLERPEFASFWAQKWSDLLRNEEKTLDYKGVQSFHRWIRQCIATGLPLNEFARELVAARGSTYRNPPANYYRANRNAVSRAESCAQVFLGVRLNCAKCHNHPFDRWTQDDYYGWTALFARVRYKVIENRRRDSNDKHEFKGEQIVYMARDGEVDDPRTGQPARPAFLGERPLAQDDERDRLRALADWIAQPENPFFARVQVNRIWFHLMGRGLVDPIDDFRATNPASHPALLEALAADFVRSGFDLRYLIRTIMNSRTYQRSSTPNENNRDDEMNYSHVTIRRLGAEQLLDGICQATGAAVKFSGYPLGMRATQVPLATAVSNRSRSPEAGDKFLRLFGKPERLLSCECERSDETTMSQAFQLVTGELLNSVLVKPDNRLGELLDGGKTIAEIVDELYWATFSRPPRGEEREAAQEFLSPAFTETGAGAVSSRRAALEDLMWSLLNGKEFLLRT